MKKKILTILLCGIMVLGITGCGNEQEISSDTNDNTKNSQEIQNSKESNSLTCSGKLFVYDDEVEHTMIVNFDENDTKVLDFKAIFESSEASIRQMKEAYCEDESEVIKSCETSSKNNKNIITVTYDLDLLGDMTDGEFKKSMTKQQMKEMLLSIPYGENHICE